MFAKTAPAASSVALDAGGGADAADDLADLEAAVVQQLPDAPLGGDEVVGVVDVPEERPLLQVVGDDDEQRAAGRSTRRASATNCARRVDPRHVLEHLVGVDDVGARVIGENRRRPALDDLEPLARAAVR